MHMNEVPTNSRSPHSRWQAAPFEALLPADLRAFTQGDAQVRRDRVRLLLDSIPLALVSSYLAAAFTAWMLYPAVGRAKLGLWLVALGLVHAVRMVGWQKMRQSAPERSLRGDLQWLRFGVLATALTWAALPLFLYPGDTFHQLEVAAIVAAICGAGASELAADAPSSRLFSLPTLTPMAIRLLFSTAPGMQALGILALVYAGYLVKAAHKTERLFLELSYLRAKAADQIHFDELTALPNRIGLNHILRDALAQAHRQHSLLAVGYLDLDDFKPVNDVHGHAAGDEVLQIIGQRLHQNLRDGDLIARVQGDEFVVAIRVLDAHRLNAELNAVFDRLHQAVETPISLSDGSAVNVDLSMGVALYPQDAHNADALLRLADAAMYQVKRRKGQRETWWQLGVSRVAAPEVERPVEPYGEEAAHRLKEIASVIPQVRDRFIEEFYLTLAQDPESAEILNALDEHAFIRLKRHQATYVDFLLGTTLTREALVSSARRVGLAHAMVGVNASMLVKGVDIFRDAMSTRLASERLLASRRYRLFKVIETRLQDDLHTQVSVIEATGQTYLAYLSRKRDDANRLWADAVSADLGALVELPGMVMTTLSRMSPQGELVLEYSAGSVNFELIERLSHGDLRSTVDPDLPSGQTIISIAWRTQSIQRADSCSEDVRMQDSTMRGWHAMARDAGIQSTVAIPFAGNDGHVEGVLTLYGRFPRQFASSWMQQWVQGVQRRIESIWAHCSATGRMVVSESQRLEYRDRLFAGGLQMYYQPIVDLQSGKVVKLEALARLKMRDDRVISPGAFIPLLGDNELARVFREGLAQSLQLLRSWTERGLGLGVSLNLPPSVLADGESAAWIREALATCQIDPRRLTLELLELQIDDGSEQALNVERLRALGVGLAMDDFGAGYSNIHRLSSMRFDVIKIDQNVTRELRRSPLETTTLLGTLIQLVRDLGRDVVVEGVEDLDTLEAAVILGAGFGQGYAIARPMPGDAVMDWIGSFHMPINSSSVGTELGALAYHWRYTEHDAPLHPMPVDRCPLHHFLVERGLGDTEAARWHETLHSGGPDAREASRNFTRWLAVRATDTASNPS